MTTVTTPPGAPSTRPARAPRPRPAALSPSRRISRAAARRANALALAAPAATTRLGAVTLELDPAPPLLPPGPPASVAHLAVGGLTLSLELGPRGTDALVREARAGPTLFLDPALAGVALEAALTPLLDAAERSLGVSLAVTSWERIGAQNAWEEPADDGAEDRVSVRLSGLEGGPETAHVVGPAVVVDIALERLEEAGRALSHPAAEAALALPMALRFPATRLRLSEVAGLEPGDVILDRLERADLRLHLSAAIWRAALLEDHTVTIAAPLDAAEAADETAAVADRVDPAAADLGEAELAVSFELARTTVPLSTARRIAPGYVLPLDGPVGAEVDILISNRRFGRGRLVDVDGTLGVEVLRVG